MNVNCQDFRAQIVHFQADELSSDSREALQLHLEGCADCAARLEIEDSFLRALRVRVQRIPAPPGLETRIRATLAAEAPAMGVVAWFRRPWFAALAAAAMLAIMVVPTLRSSDYVVSSAGTVEILGQEVVVVDRNCDSAGRSLLQQRNCRNPKHINVLKVSDGNYWNVSLDQENGEKILLDHRLRGKRLVVNGDFYTRIRTLRMTHYEVLGDSVSRGQGGPIHLSVTRD